MPTVTDCGNVVHNSYDGREVGQVCKDALDLLGVALTDHAHDWTRKEREAYEHAVRLLTWRYNLPVD